MDLCGGGLPRVGRGMDIVAGKRGAWIVHALK